MKFSRIYKIKWWYPYVWRKFRRISANSSEIQECVSATNSTPTRAPNASQLFFCLPKLKICGQVWGRKEERPDAWANVGLSCDIARTYKDQSVDLLSLKTEAFSIVFFFFFFFYLGDSKVLQYFGSTCKRSMNVNEANQAMEGTH